MRAVVSMAVVGGGSKTLEFISDEWLALRRPDWPSGTIGWNTTKYSLMRRIGRNTLPEVIEAFIGDGEPAKSQHRQFLQEFGLHPSDVLF